MFLKENKEEEIDLLKLNVLKYFLEDGFWFCFCFFGIELKVKFYFVVKGIFLEDSEKCFVVFFDDVMKMVDDIVEVIVK